MDPITSSQFGSGMGGLLGGLFGNSGAPYKSAMDEYMRWGNRAAGAQNPFYNAGTGAIPDYQNWLKSMQNPSGFINNLMGQYKESPWANFMQKQGVRAGQNAASASGLTGSTPFAQQLQQNAENISSQDMGNWLQNVLGINTQYGQGLNTLMTGGQNSANALTNLYGNMANFMGQGAYGQQAGRNQDFWNSIGGGLSLIGMFL